MPASDFCLVATTLDEERRSGGGRADLSARAQFGLDLAAVDRSAPSRCVRRVHRVQRGFRRRHVVGRLEKLDHDRGALVRVVEDLDPLGGMSTGGPPRDSASAKRPAR